MTTHYQQQKRFMSLFEQPVHRNEAGAELYVRLVNEEYGELLKAWDDATNKIGTPAFNPEAAITETVDGITDSLVVLNGLLVSLGVDGDELWKYMNPPGDGTLYQQVSVISGEPIMLNGMRAHDCLERIGVWMGRINSVWEKLEGHVEDEAADAAIRVISSATIQAIANLADMMNALGVNGQDCWDEVYASNMSKLCPDSGKPIFREDGKILKGSAFRKPDLLSIIQRDLGGEDDV